jgi:hypothetical protein
MEQSIQDLLFIMPLAVGHSNDGFQGESKMEEKKVGA